jgi:ferrous iron transport protein B
VIATVASKHVGLEKLKQFMVIPVNGNTKLPLINYDAYIEGEINDLTQAILKDEQLSQQYEPRWLAIQLLEGDLSLLDDNWTNTPLGQVLPGSLTRLSEIYGSSTDISVADHRYQFIHQVLNLVIERGSKGFSSSDKVDRIVTHRWLGIPIFFALMYLIFNLVQNVSAPYLDWIDGLFSGPFTRWSLAVLNWVHAPAWLTSLAVDGVLAGLGGVLVFVPGLFIMYLLLAVMEQSGYLARAAFVMDRFMTKIGLHGKSFIPMILGFGCNVPAIYATRTIEKRQARILTGLLIPFMSCSARLPVYIIFGLAFFPGRANLVIFSLYLLGILVAAGIGLVISRLAFKGETFGILVMELPGYHMPILRDVLRYAKSRTAVFIRNAGTVIVVFSVIIWLLLNFPQGVEKARDSYFGKLSSALAPLLQPAGFGHWEASGSLVTGLVAKEIVVSTLAQIYHLPEDTQAQQPTNLGNDLVEITAGFGRATLDTGKQLLEVLTPGVTLFKDQTNGENVALSQALRKNFTPLSAYAFLVFVLLYVPCAATIAAQKQEFGWKWTALSIVITLIVPWVMATLVYQGGLLLGLG